MKKTLKRGLVLDRIERIIFWQAKQSRCISFLKKAFGSLEGGHEIVDTCKDILPQVQRIVKELSLEEE